MMKIPICCKGGNSEMVSVILPKPLGIHAFPDKLRNFSDGNGLVFDISYSKPR